MGAWKLKKIPECGTTRGYDYHTRQLKEEPCDPCRLAKKEHWKKRREDNKAKLNLNNRNRRNKNKEYESNSAARRRNFSLVVGGWSYELVINTYGMGCYICGKEIDLNAPRKVGVPGWEMGFHVDHIIPISKGGLDKLENVRPVHAYCNQRKGAKLDEFRQI